MEKIMISEESIEHFLKKKKEAGVSETALYRYRVRLVNLLKWMKEDPCLDKERLQAWRRTLEESYAKLTVQKYVVTINGYLKEIGHPELCIAKVYSKDLTGQQFGYLTALEATEKRYRKDVVWRCRCQCGQEVEVPTTSLTSKNTLSCGCKLTEVLQQANQYIEGTSLRQSLKDEPKSTRNQSGYTGVSVKQGKWMARITYKGKLYHLGVFEKKEDAIEARAKAKQWVIEDALELQEKYKERIKAKG